MDCLFVELRVPKQIHLNPSFLDLFLLWQINFQWLDRLKNIGQNFLKNKFTIFIYAKMRNKQKYSRLELRRAGMLLYVLRMIP